MTTLSVFVFQGYDIRFSEGKPVANDVAAALGYSDPAKTASTKVSAKNKGVTRIQTPGGIQSVTVLKPEGVIQLIATSRLPNAMDLADQMGLTVLKCLPEQESIRVLEVAFADLNPIRQFAVHGYRIDLYLAEINVAVECDENKHSWKSGYPDDKSREAKIKSALGCSFVRYNPNKAGFNLGSVIRAIRELI